MPAGNTHQPPPPDVAAAADSTMQTKTNAISPVTCSLCAANLTGITAPPAEVTGVVCSCRQSCTPPATNTTTTTTPAARTSRNADSNEVEGVANSLSQLVLGQPLVQELSAEIMAADPEAPTTAVVPEEPVGRTKAVPSRRQTEPLILLTKPNAPAPTKPARKLTQAPSAPKSDRYIPDPFVDITRIRMKSRGSHCLYPGATFQGLQKSGTSNYDVSVQIVDVDLSSSFLCGYLCIRGLTADFPEMTTYFDAEIIGSRHGFLTGKWGASDAEDMSHWANFPAFRQVKNELEGPKLTLPNRDRSVIFMRWKERFLVPDHRVQDVSGASFAGFYYICIDMDGRAGADISRAPTTMSRATSGQDGHLAAPKSPTSPRLARNVLPSAMSRRTSSASKHGPATMSGFYYHPNSEPYQQLSLSHIPEVSHAAFEFR